jgi:hypothetical protein
MGRVMLTLNGGGSAPSLDEVARRLEVRPAQLDADFGVVLIDPDRHLYTVRGDEDAAAAAAERDGVEGPFSNPRIEPFGPPRR